ncbi:MAG: ATPase, T2SS/T4P/T4SS family [Desulfosarcinaceae bacterium]
MEIFGHPIDLPLDNQAVAIRVGEFMIEENLIRPDDLAQALDVQSQERQDADLPMGALLTRYTARRLDLISKPELARINGIKARQRALADILADIGLADKETQIRVLDRYRPEIIAEHVAAILFREALKQGARSIHLDQDDQGVELRLRTGSTYHRAYLDQPPGQALRTAQALMRWIKSLARLEGASGQLPGNGTFHLKIAPAPGQERRSIEGQLTFCPTRCGECMTLLLTQSSEYGMRLDELPYSPGVVAAFKKLLESGSGLIVVCGPAGSGRRATLYAALRHLRRFDTRILTAEDPITRPIAGIGQTQADPGRGLPLDRLLRTLIRQEPDIVLVDSLDDGPTATAAFDAVEQGLLVLGSLTAPDAVTAIANLRALNIDMDRIGTGLIGILAQRKLPRICNACRQPASPAPHEWRLLFDKEPAPGSFFAGAGCPACGHTGFRGTALIAELLEPAPQTALAIRQGSGPDELDGLAKAQGMGTLLKDGLDKSDQVRLADLIRAVPMDMIRKFAGGEKPMVFEAVEAGAPRLLEIEERASLSLHNPGEQAEEIDQLFLRYRQMREKAGQPAAEADVEDFRRFISESVREVKIKYACPAVRVDLIGNDERVEIVGVPVGVR